MPAWTRFVRFLAEDGKEYGGEPEDSSLDVGLAVLGSEPVQVKVLSDSSPLSDSAVFTGEMKAIKKLLSPLSAAEVGTIRCIGMNYKDHAAELNSRIPEMPELFTKPANTLIGPSEPIVLPKVAPEAVDSEVELVIVIGKECKNVDASSALDYVLGYTLANDLTCRDIQARLAQWGYCKGFDTFCPMGPALVSAQLLADPHQLSLKTSLDGNGMQDGNTKNMIFSVPEIIQYVSRDTTLPKGTVILTGTPSGIGHSYHPPRYLRDGATLRVSIGGGIGTLTNPIVKAE